MGESRSIKRTYLLKSTATAILFFLCIPSLSLAEIIPDGTLPIPSKVTKSDNTLIINGGTSDGKNIFHSFERFDLPTDNEALFDNTSTVDSIILRVTGGSISKIDGKISSQGNANLFFLNPQGINFGPHATLDIGGSFIASTADRIKFANGGEFSAINPQAPPLLTVNVPIGLQFGSNPGAIFIQGTGHNLREQDLTFPRFDRSNSLGGLRVKPGNTLALIGGDVSLAGATLTAESGHLELGSVSSGWVSLSSTSAGWNFGYEDVSIFQNIQLSQLAAADVSGLGGGSIQVQGARVKVTDGSFLLIQTEGDRLGGDLIVNASESLEIVGTILNRGKSPDQNQIVRSTLVNQTVGDGKGGNIVISSQQLLVRDGGIITTRSLNDGSGGDINLKVSESVEVIAVSRDNPNLSSFITAVTQGAGNAGNITLSTNRLRIINGGILASTGINLTIPDGETTLSPIPNPGSVGNVIVNATESVQVIGSFQEGIFTSVLASNNFGDGDAGDLTINTRKVEVRDGGRIDVATFASGNAGGLTINASESVEVSGKAQGFINPSQIISSANILDEATRNFFFLPEVPSGASGDVTINTPRLRIADEAQVTVRNDGTGNAGNLLVNADSIFLDDQGGITAATASGEGGNITLNVQDILQLRRNSQISAEAGGTGNGGNIDINAKFVVAVPEENSDIIANAVEGRGGNIRIATQGIFGLESRDSLTPLSDITASSEFGVDGIIEINRPEVDPTKELVEFPEEPINVARLIDQNLCAAGQGSEFTVTSRGGLPDSPNQALKPDAAWEDWRIEESSEQGVGTQQDVPGQTPASTPEQATSDSEQEKIVEFQGWAINARGNVVLTAEPNTMTPKGVLLPPPGCQQLSEKLSSR